VVPYAWAALKVEEGVHPFSAGGITFAFRLLLWTFLFGTTFCALNTKCQHFTWRASDGPSSCSSGARSFCGFPLLGDGWQATGRAA